MYRGFKTYRHYINYQLHALSAVICGDDAVIDDELARRGLNSVKDLSLRDAQALVKDLTLVAKKVSNNVNQLKEAIGQGRMTNAQRSAIIKVAKYIFNWENEAIFSFILSTFPDYRNKLSRWEIENSKLYKLFGLLSSKDADKIIKRLDAIKKRNQKEQKNEIHNA